MNLPTAEWMLIVMVAEAVLLGALTTRIVCRRSERAAARLEQTEAQQ